MGSCKQSFQLSWSPSCDLLFLHSIWSFLTYYFGEGNGTPLQYSCLENPMDGGAWWAAVHGVAKSRTRLSDFTFTFHFYALEKEMATHFSVLAWRIPGTVEPGGPLSMGSHRVRHDWSDLAAAATYYLASLVAQNGKASACYAGNLGLIPGLGRSPGEGNGHPLQYSCLENSIDRGAWGAIVHGVAKILFNFLIMSLVYHLCIPTKLGLDRGFCVIHSSMYPRYLEKFLVQCLLLCGVYMPKITCIWNVG